MLEVHAQQSDSAFIRYSTLAAYPYSTITSATSNTSHVVLTTSSGEVFTMDPDDGLLTALPPVVGPIPIDVIIHGSANWLVLADNSVRILDTVSREWHDPYGYPINGYSFNVKGELWIARGEHFVNVAPAGSSLDSVLIVLYDPAARPLTFVANNESQVYAHIGDSIIYVKSADRVDTINVSWLGFVLSLVELGDGSVLVLSTTGVTGVLNPEQPSVSSLTEAFGLGFIPWHTVYSGDSERVVTVMSTHTFGNSVFEIRSKSDIQTVPIDTTEIRRLDKGVFTKKGRWHLFRGGTRQNLDNGLKISGYVTPSNIATGLPHTTSSMLDNDYVASFRYNDTLVLFRSPQESRKVDISKIRTLDIGNVIFLIHDKRSINAVCYRGIAVSNDSGSSWKSVVIADFGRVNRAFRHVDTLLVIGNDSVFQSVDGEHWSTMPCKPVFNEYGLQLSSDQLILMHGWGVDIYSSKSNGEPHFRLDQVYDRPPHVLLGSDSKGFTLLSFQEPDAEGSIPRGFLRVASVSGISEEKYIQWPKGLFRADSRCYGRKFGDTITVVDLKHSIIVMFLRDSVFRTYRFNPGSLRPFDNHPIGKLFELKFTNSRNLVYRSANSLVELHVQIEDQPISGVEEILFAQIHNAYPNPASSVLHADLGFLQGAGSSFKVGLYSIDGRSLIRESFVSRTTLGQERIIVSLDIGNVPNGPAILTVSNGVHNHATLVFIKK
ncbi:MAG: hypothetical protein IPM83_13040 [Ignavibacteria bacterium]|nr:hypothetical protein [Ignavibacteria bacterium]